MTQTTILEYYSIPFYEIYKEINDDKVRYSLMTEFPHPARKHFWSLLPKNKYQYHEATKLLDTYSNNIIRKIKDIVKIHSLAYWLHFYRRIGPFSCGDNEHPITIGATRAIMEAAFHKYADNKFCSNINISSYIDLISLANGCYTKNIYKNIGEEILRTTQMVLCNINIDDMIVIYRLEKLAYEIWYTEAVKRSLSKGAILFINIQEYPYFYSDKTEEHEKLISIYDKRIGGIEATSKGVIINAIEEGNNSTIYLPVYNVYHLNTTNHIKFLSNIDINDNLPTNFIWYPVNIRAYRNSHKPLAQKFYNKYNVSLDDILSIIICLSYHALYEWKHMKYRIINYYKRAYAGPYTMKSILSIIKEYKGYAKKALECNSILNNNNSIKKALCFWSKDYVVDSIDIKYPGPHSIFLKIDKNKYIIDYAWIANRLYHLFWNITLDDESFKGALLENTIRKETPIIRYYKINGQKIKETDHSIAINDHLIIIECKVVQKSIGFDRGQLKAIKYREEKVIEEGLKQVDTFANLVANEPKNDCYNITMYKDILPLVISPFVEYLPSLDKRYWIADSIPRVLTPHEFRELLNEKEVFDKAWNRIKIKK